MDAIIAVMQVGKRILDGTKTVNVLFHGLETRPVNPRTAKPVKYTRVFGSEYYTQVDYNEKLSVTNAPEGRTIQSVYLEIAALAASKGILEGVIKIEGLKVTDDPDILALYEAYGVVEGEAASQKGDPIEIKKRGIK